MRSPIRWFKRQLELSRHSPRRIEVEREFADACGHPVQLVPAATKGGYDEIYYALDSARQRFAVVRINSRFKQQNDPIGPQDPGIPLDSKGRLEREWSAYQKLYGASISPQPLWKSHDAIACSWIDWPRASRYLVKHRKSFWHIAERIFPMVAKMHECGVTHLDLNLGNILVDPDGPGAMVIDFEFGPTAWVTEQQQRAFDYLRLLDDCTKPRRGGGELLSDMDRMIDILDQCVDPACRAAPLSFVFGKLVQLRRQPELCEKLKKVFPNL